jgi:hypothetical protein
MVTTFNSSKEGLSIPYSLFPAFAHFFARSPDRLSTVHWALFTVFIHFFTHSLLHGFSLFAVNCPLFTVIQITVSANSPQTCV